MVKLYMTASGEVVLRGKLSTIPDHDTVLCMADIIRLAVLNTSLRGMTEINTTLHPTGSP